MNEEYDTIMKRLVEKKNQIKETETNIKQKAEQEKKKALEELEAKKELEKIQAVELAKQENKEVEVEVEDKYDKLVKKIVEDNYAGEKTYLLIEVSGIDVSVAKELKKFLDGNNIKYKKETR